MAAPTVPTRIEGDMHVNGSFTAKAITPTDNSVTDSKIPAGAGINPLKLGHVHRAFYAQPNTAATTVTIPIAAIYGVSGTVLRVVAGSIAVAIGAATVTVDIRKNGVTILTAVITLSSASVARVGQAATISVPALAAGDLLEAVIVATVAGGTLPTGLFVAVTHTEDPA